MLNKDAQEEHINGPIGLSQPILGNSSDAKDKIAEKVEEHVADKTLEPEPEAKLLLEGE